jgi:glycine cleavage system H protein
MAIIMGCTFPEDRLYHPEFNIWVLHSGERVRFGLTEYACSLAGEFIDFAPRAIGQTIYKGRTCASLESQVWVGPVKSPCGGEIIEINERVREHPELINEDPYGDGWLVTLRPIDWGLDQLGLLSGEKALSAFKARMEKEKNNGRLS